MGGVYREIVPNQKIVTTEKFDQAWYPGEAGRPLVLTEQAGRPQSPRPLLYQSREARDGIIKSGMETGVARSYDRLAEQLGERLAKQR